MTDVSTRGADQSRPKAYSYLRFSTPEQSKGDSFRRQMSMAVAYAAKHDLELDRDLTFHDVGVSAYRGQNAEAGRLAHFVEAVKSGQVPQGSVLLVEQLDRLSRLTPRKALRVLEDIVETGVSVVTLNDGRQYSAKSLDQDHMDLMISILTFMRANEESASKSRRLKEAWTAKRADIGNRPLTSRTPAWVKVSSDKQRLEVIDDRAELVRRIFRMTLDGHGQHRIAAALNDEGIKPWGRGKFWHRSYIAKILSNPAVVGTLHPHLSEFEGGKKVRKPLDPVEDYFPAVVTVEAFQAAQALRQAHGAAQRGRHSHGPVAHVLAGLATCCLCGATMTRVSKGKRSRPTYVCTRAKTGAGCAYKSVPCELVEQAVLRGLPERLRSLEGVDGSEELAAAIHAADDAVSELADQAAVLLDNLSYERSPALAHELRLKEAAWEDAKIVLQGLLERQEAATGRTIRVRIDKALEALELPPGDRSVPAINFALRGIFDRATIDWRSLAVDLEWKHGGTLVLRYASGLRAWQGDQEDVGR